MKDRNHTKKVNLALDLPFNRGAIGGRAPFMGMGITLGEKVKLVQIGIPEGSTSSYPIIRENVVISQL